MSCSIIAKPVGPGRNLTCDYCYYLGKMALFRHGQDSGAGSGKGSMLMSEPVLEAFVRQMFESSGTHPVEFVWQGGEPLLAGIPFFEKAIGLQRQYAGGRPFANVIQTNGTLLDAAWGKFLAKNKILVGISLDAPEELHDAYREDNSGRGSFKKVMAGLEVLWKHGIDYNILATINRENAAHPLEIYRFLKQQSQGFLQFIPVVRPNETSPEGVAPWNVTPRQLGEFYTSIYDEWIKGDVGKVFVQLFNAPRGNHLGAAPPVCYYAHECPRTGQLEHTGDMYACDHFVSPEYLLGNILNHPLQEMLDSKEQSSFRRVKSRELSSECRTCLVLFACKGECPKNRFLPANDGSSPKNYLCEGYRRFFEHSTPTMRRIALLLRQGRPARDIIKRIE